MNIGDLLNSKKNNFNFVRLVASIAVIFSHAFVLSLTESYNGEHEPLFQLTNRQISVGTTCVYIFFVISGLLITRSYDRSKNLQKYSRARVLRIFPALIVTVLVTTFIMGPIVTTEKMSDYFSSADTWISLKNTIMIFGAHNHLPGVFENNVYGPAVNGSLWTLQFEIFCYALVGILGAMKLLNKYTSFLLFTALLLLNFLGFPYLETILYFSIGMNFYFFKDKIKITNLFGISSLIVLIIGTYFGFYKYVAPFVFPYLILFVCLSPKVKLPSVERIGDLSYGIYIFAFPIQQLLVNYFGEMNPIINFFVATLLVTPLAVLSWNVIEKPCLKLK